MSEDDFDQALKFEVLAASLRSDQKQSSDMLEGLANMLETALPQGATVVRKGQLFSNKKSVEKVTVKFDEYQYEITREKHGAFKARSQKIVRDVVLKTSEIPFDKCIDNILAELEKLSQNNATARRALNKIVLDM